MSLHALPPEQWPTLLTSRDLADILRTSKRTAERHMSDQTFGAAVKIGARRYLRRATFLRALEQLEEPPPPVTTGPGHRTFKGRR